MYKTSTEYLKIKGKYYSKIKTPSSIYLFGKILRKNNGILQKEDLYRELLSLDKNEFENVLNYLLFTREIGVDSNGKLVYTRNLNGIEAYLKSDKIWEEKEEVVEENFKVGMQLGKYKDLEDYEGQINSSFKALSLDPFIGKVVPEKNIPEEWKKRYKELDFFMQYPINKKLMIIYSILSSDIFTKVVVLQILNRHFYEKILEIPFPWN